MEKVKKLKLMEIFKARKHHKQKPKKVKTYLSNTEKKFAKLK